MHEVGFEPARNARKFAIIPSKARKSAMRDIHRVDAELGMHRSDGPREHAALPRTSEKVNLRRIGEGKKSAREIGRVPRDSVESRGCGERRNHDPHRAPLAGMATAANPRGAGPNETSLFSRAPSASSTMQLANVIIQSGSNRSKGSPSASPRTKMNSIIAMRTALGGPLRNDRI